LQVNDGSNLSGIQVVVEPTAAGFELLEGGRITTGGQSGQKAAAGILSCSARKRVQQLDTATAADTSHVVMLVLVLVSPAGSWHMC
jgi:hypothetical protein